MRIARRAVGYLEPSYHAGSNHLPPPGHHERLLRYELAAARQEPIFTRRARNE